MMRQHITHTIGLSVLLASVMLVNTGCSIKMVKRSPRDTTTIAALEDELGQLRRARADLERRLSQEIGRQEISVGMDDRGLVITFLDEVLFDSGKAALRSGAHRSLDQVASVLNQDLRTEHVGIEGHTDNRPIKHSNWRSNWELSTARAVSVLHYLVDERGVEPERVSATGYGEFHPVETNDSAAGRQRNRRVEIVILPAQSRTVAQRGGSGGLE